VKEKASISELCYIADDFYDLLHLEMKTLDTKYLSYARDLLNEFVRIRHSKIVQFASVLKSGSILEKNMSDEEKNLFFMVQYSTRLFYKKINIQ
jgi:DNA replication initiation complex subunit (GINS family)